MKILTHSYQMLAVALLLTIVSGCAGPFRTLTPEMIRTDLEGVRERYYVPSLGVAEVTVDDITSYGPVGKARIDKDILVTADSLYQLGSCTKAMTATALNKLMQDGSFSWDTRLLDIFPEFAAKANPDYRAITLGDIVSHQAGFPSAGDPATFAELRKYHGTMSQYLGEILQESSRIRRGRFYYSNNGYAALGAVIERRTGLVYSEAMKKLLFEPLGVKAYFSFPTFVSLEQPFGYTANWGAAAPARLIDQTIPEVLSPAGIVSLTLHDYARFVQLHLRGMLGQDDSGISAEMINQLHKTRIITGEPFEQSYAAGWFIEKINGETIHWHSGSAGNFVVKMAINPARRKGVVVVTNVGDIQGVRVSWDIMERMLTGESAKLVLPILTSER
jgi:CubicO group peptidase (beta-lactamase class C family)